MFTQCRSALLKAFDSEETTIRSGITIDGHKFDVHRYVQVDQHFTKL